jgi:alpha-tubulin suppressor-like RCC1 family protein
MALRRPGSVSIVRAGVIAVASLALVVATGTAAGATFHAGGRVQPSVTSVSATSGPATGGVTVTVKGSDFSGVRSVSFGTVKGTGLHVSLSHKSLTVVAPAHVVGAVDVRVATGAGTSAITSHDVFTYRTYSTIAGGDYHSCAVDGGAVRCWGYNDSGQLGNNTMANSSSPVRVHGLSHVVAVTAGEYNTCAVIDSGIAKCWGDNAFHELGKSSQTKETTPVTVSGLTDVVALSVGYAHGCAIVADGTVRCWGQNALGELGNNSTTDSALPVKVHGLTHATSIAVNDFYSCATLATGAVKCWGLNDFGQLGDGTTSNSHVPRTVIGASHATLVSAGFNAACALISGGTVSCWGQNPDGELGIGTTTDAHTAKSVSGLVSVNLLSVGGLGGCAAIKGHVFCWGVSGGDEIGNGINHPTEPALTPQAVAKLGVVKELANGAFHRLVRLPNGSLRTWGLNSDGELGNATTTDSPVPVPVITPG